ncbi:MAG: hypothetical protein GTN70_05855 [Deltaproteobacteria bacterium]|nr:hypothetical protein [Deltaproteobacteria bacterium]NIS77205.1 hypothetical protein [Deltaproteobacteria bacterium]
MAFSATVIRVLLTSPSDVEDERGMVQAFLNEWNERNTLSEKVVLWPVLWPPHAGEDGGGKGKGETSGNQLDDCDLLVGIFWTRTDSHEGGAKKDEIDALARFVESGKDALLYFSTRPVVPDSIDPEQYGRLRTFRERVEKKGSTFPFGSADELMDMVNGHLLEKIKTINGNQKSEKTAQRAESAVTSPPRKSEEARQEDKPPEKEQKPKSDAETPVDKAKDRVQPDESQKRTQEPAAETTEIPLGDVELDIEPIDDAAQAGQKGEKGKSQAPEKEKSPKPSPEDKPEPKKEHVASDGELKKIKKKFMLELSHLEIEWIMERDGEPEDIKDGKSILENVCKKLMDLQVAVQLKVDMDMIETLMKIIDDGRKMKEYKLLSDSGKSYDAFWKKGNDIFSRYKKFLDALS